MLRLQLLSTYATNHKHPTLVLLPQSQIHDRQQIDHKSCINLCRDIDQNLSAHSRKVRNEKLVDVAVLLAPVLLAPWVVALPVNLCPVQFAKIPAMHIKFIQ